MTIETYDQWLAQHGQDDISDTIQCEGCGIYMTASIESGLCGPCEEADSEWLNAELRLWELSMGELLRLEENETEWTQNQKPLPAAGPEGVKGIWTARKHKGG